MRATQIIHAIEYEVQTNGTLVPIGDVESNGHGPSVPASSIEPERIDWLWPGFVPFGMTTVAAGFPGVGKSTILTDLAARTSKEGRGVLVVTAEDHLTAVVRPRLEAAGADLELVRVFTDSLTLPDGVAVLREQIEKHEIGLVTLDPLVAFIGEGVNTHRDHHVRRVLAPLAELAEESGTAVVVVIHTNKGLDSNPLMRISGSIGFTGAARSVLLAADDPKDEDRRILAVAKSNLAECPTPLAYRLAGVDLEGGITTSRVEWLGEAPEVDVRELLASRDPDERGAAEDAIEFLRACGLLETARPAKEVLREAKAEGHADRTVQRARKQLGIPSGRDGFGRAGVWYWGPRPNEAPIDATHRRQDHLGELAPMDLPAETDGQAPRGAKVGEFGVEPRTQVENSHEKPVETEAPCVRCDRYGPDHAGEHIASWGADWRSVPLGGAKS